jgi:WD40 repeat protein
MPGKQRKARRGKGSNKKGGDVTASSSVPPATLASRRVDALKAQIVQLHARDATITERIERDHREQDERIERAQREQDEVRAALAEAEAELELEVLAPVANGVDPTEWLPEELLMVILIQVVTAGVCGLVCRRWHNACQDGRVQRRAWEGRWDGYNAGWRTPQKLDGHTGSVLALAVGPDGTVYSAGDDTMVRAWSGADGTLLRALKGHTVQVRSLAVGADGTVYSGGFDGAIRVWSGIDGSSVRVFEGHPGVIVLALAITADGTLFSGAGDRTIRVWSDGDHVRTLTGHTGTVFALAIGTHGKLYSGSADNTVRVWSIADGTHLSTLEGHTDDVLSLAVGLDGTVYSGSSDGTIRAWSGEDGHLRRTLAGRTGCVVSLAIGADSTLYSGSVDNMMRVWCGGSGAARHILSVDSIVWALAVCPNGKLYTGLSRHGASRGAITIW